MSRLTGPPKWAVRLTWASLVAACAAVGGVAAWAYDQWRDVGKPLWSGQFKTQPAHTYVKGVPDRGGLAVDDDE